ncbi:MAG: HEAT repeat domain-containing protein [Balneolaceae bacterium]
MTQPLHNWDVVLLTAILSLLIAATLLTILVTLLTRWRIDYVERRKRVLRESIGDLIIQYTSGDLERGEVEEHLTEKIDYIVLLELVNQLEQSLEGAERKRLQELMEVQSTFDHFLNRFETGTPIEKAKACLYYARIRKIDPNHLPVLKALTRSPEPYLCYSAASALMVHGSLALKRDAFATILQNPSISSMAVTDLIVNFTRFGGEYHDAEATILTEFIQKESISAERRSLLIYSLEQLGYIQAMETLYRYYRQLDKQQAPPDLLEALIRVLARFGMAEILPDLYRFFSNSPHAILREAAADAYGLLKAPESIPHLHWLINDPDFHVRHQAALSLATFPGEDLDRVPSLMLDPDEWEELKDEVQPQTKSSP